MRAFAGYFLIGSLAALATGLVTVTGADLAVGARPVVEPGQLIQSVDRTHKSDRLDLGTVSAPAVAPVPPHQKEPATLPIGCEPAVSALAGPAQSNNASRCIAEYPSALRIIAS